MRYKDESQIKKEIQGKKIELKQKVAQLERQKQKIEAIKKDVVGLYINSKDESLPFELIFVLFYSYS